MSPTLISLSPELLDRILCLCSRSDLVALSQVNKVLRGISEDILYREIYVSFYALDLVEFKTDTMCELFEGKNLFRTLTSPTSEYKIHFLRSLHIQFEFDSIWRYNLQEPNKLLLNTISSLLPRSPKLVDLRVMLDQHAPVNEYSNGEFSNVLCASGILENLHTLYLDVMNNVPRIVETKTSLRLLGLHISEVDIEVTIPLEKVYSILASRRAAIPYWWPEMMTKELIVFLLETPQPLFDLYYLTFVPALYSPGSAEYVCRRVIESLAQDLGNRYPTKCEEVIGLQLYMIDVTEASGIKSMRLEQVIEMMEAMVKLFRRCKKFKIATPAHDMKVWRFQFFIDTVPQFVDLTRLTFRIPIAEVDGEQQVLEAFFFMITDLRSFIVETLMDRCPKLDTVVIISYNHNAIMEKESGWKAIIRDNDVLTAEGWRGHSQLIDDEEGDEDMEEEEEEEYSDDDPETIIYYSRHPPPFAMNPPPM